jgi:hypothetical protein
MGTSLPDDRHDALLTLTSQSGASPDLVNASVATLAGTSGPTKDLWNIYWDDEGVAAGAFPERAKAWLLSIGITSNHITQMWRDYWAAGGGGGETDFLLLLIQGTTATGEGDTDPTVTRATTKVIQDHEGKLITIDSGEIAQNGARRVKNMMTASEDMTNGAYTDGSGATSSATSTVFDGTSNADVTQSITITDDGSGAEGRYFNFSVKISLDSGTISADNEVTIRVAGTAVTAGALELGTQLGATAKRFELIVATDAAGTTVIPEVECDSAVTLGITEWQVEEVTGQFSHTCGDYASVGVASDPWHGAGVDGVKYFSTHNGNTVASTGIVTEATGADINSSNSQFAYNDGVQTAGGHFSTPDSAAVSVESDITIIAYLVLDDWGLSNRGIAGCYGPDPSYAYQLDVTTSQIINLNLSPDGTGGAVVTGSSTTGVPFTDGTGGWVRTTWDDSANEVNFYYSYDPPTTSPTAVAWTQLGTADVTLTSAGIADMSVPLTIMSRGNGNNSLEGYCHRAVVIASTDPTATPAVDFNPNDYIGAAAGTWTSSGTNAEVWTANGEASVASAKTSTTPANYPAMHWTANGPNGLESEQAATNIMTYSNTLSNSIWAYNDGSRVYNAGVGSDGKKTMTRFDCSTTASQHKGVGYQNLTIEADEDYCFSAEVKSDGVRYISLVWPEYGASNDNATVLYDLYTGLRVDTRTEGEGTIVNSGMIPLPNGVYRVYATFNIGSVTGIYAWILSSDTASPSYDTDGRPQYTGTAGEDFFVGRVQVEKGTYPTTYIETTSATATRNKDQLSYAGASNAAYPLTGRVRYTPNQIDTIGVLLDINGGDPAGFYDSSDSKHDITATGAVQATAQSKIDSSSIDMDSSGGEYIRVEDPMEDFAFGSSDFTIEMYIRPGTINTWNYIYDNRFSGSDTNRVAAIINSSGNVVIYHNNNSRIVSSSALSTGTWYHIAVVRSSGTLTVYIDGTADGTWTDGTTYVSGGDLWFGDYPQSNVYGLNGYMDEIRVSDSARYTGSFTPSTTAFTSDANTLLLIHSDLTSSEEDRTELSVTAAGKPRLLVRSGGSDVADITADDALVLGVSTLINFVVDTDDARLYVDEVATGTDDTSLAVPATPAAINVGQDYVGANQPNGFITDVGLANENQSTAEIITWNAE